MDCEKWIPVPCDICCREYYPHDLTRFGEGEHAVYICEECAENDQICEECGDVTTDWGTTDEGEVICRQCAARLEIA